jgi:hypothetical protein
MTIAENSGHTTGPRMYFMYVPEYVKEMFRKMDRDGGKRRIWVLS